MPLQERDDHPGSTSLHLCTAALFWTCLFRKRKRQRPFGDFGTVCVCFQWRLEKLARLLPNLESHSSNPNCQTITVLFGSKRK